MATFDAFMGTLVAELDREEALAWCAFGQDGARFRVGIKREARRHAETQGVKAVVVWAERAHVASVTPTPSSEAFDRELAEHRTRMASSR